MAKVLSLNCRKAGLTITTFASVSVGDQLMIQCCVTLALLSQMEECQFLVIFHEPTGNAG